MRRHARRGRWALASGAALLSAVCLVPAATAAPPPQGSPQPLSVSLTGTNGVGRIMVPGRTCADGGTGAYRHYSIDTALPGGVLSQLTGTLRGSFDVHHDGPEPPVAPAAGGAFLLGDQSHVTFTNYRGAVQLILHGGQCGGTTFPLTFSADGHQISFGTSATPASGSWDVSTTPGTTNGAYRSATGSGTYKLTAGVAPGADNPWTLQLSGNISILEPNLKATVASVFWGNLGLDYAFRIVSVTYTITNSGTGDAFNTSLVSTSSPTDDVIPMGPQPQALGDLLAGQSTQVTVRYQIGLLSPCTLVILNCHFTSVVNMSGPDALDVPGNFSSTLPVTAPNLPPPLS